MFSINWESTLESGGFFMSGCVDVVTNSTTSLSLEFLCWTEYLVCPRHMWRHFLQSSNHCNGISVNYRHQNWVCFYTVWVEVSPYLKCFWSFLTPWINHDSRSQSDELMSFSTLASGQFWTSFFSFPHVCTAFGWITIYFITVMLLVDHAVLIPGCTTSFRVFFKFYQWIFFSSFIHKKFWKILRWFLLLCLAETSLFNNPPLTEAFGELSVWDGSYAF